MSHLDPLINDSTVARITNRLKLYKTNPNAYAYVSQVLVAYSTGKLKGEQSPEVYRIIEEFEVLRNETESTGLDDVDLPYDEDYQIKPSQRGWGWVLAIFALLMALFLLCGYALFNI